MNATPKARHADTATSAHPPRLRAARTPAVVVAAPAGMPGWQRRAAYGLSALLVATGVAWLLLHYFLRVDSEFGPSPNPLEHPLLALHGAGAMAFLIVLGSLLPAHVLRGWQQRRNRLTGLTLIGVSGFLALTGYGLYYLGGETLRAWIGAAHWGVGLALGGLLVWHVAAARRARG